MMYKYKWPSTPYVQDVAPEDLYDRFEGHGVIVTEKLDGENTTMTREFIHARSLDSRSHPSRDYVKGMWGARRHLIPEGIYVVGENVYAKHSIFYPEISGPFYIFAMYKVQDERPRVLSWDQTVSIAKQIGLPMVPVIGETIVGAKHFHLWENRPSRFGPESEGFVARLAKEFWLSDWGTHVVKWVRPNHVQTDAHWMYQPVVRNGVEE